MRPLFIWNSSTRFPILQTPFKKGLTKSLSGAIIDPASYQEVCGQKGLYYDKDSLVEAGEHLGSSPTLPLRRVAISFTPCPQISRCDVVYHRADASRSSFGTHSIGPVSRSTSTKLVIPWSAFSAPSSCIVVIPCCFAKASSSSCVGFL